MIRRRAAIVVAAGLALTLAGCASGANTPGDTGSGGASQASNKFEKKSPLKFGYSVYDQTDPYFIAYVAGVRAQAKKNNIQVVISDQKDQQQLQVSGSQQLISQNISALLISPIQPDALPATITSAHRAKIPVVVGDVGAKGDYDYYIQSDNPAGGKQAADYLGKKFDDGKTHEIAVIENQPGVVAGAERAKGFTDGIKAYPNLKLVGQVPGQTIEAAYKAGQDLLSAHPNIDAIFCTNSNNVQGASRAAETSGKNPAIIGFNGDPIELKLIAEGKEEATVAQDPYGQGQHLVDAALDLLNGKTPDYTDESTKTFELGTTLVTKDNLEDYKAKLASQQ